MQLYIGNKNYSTWSLRPWILMKKFNLEFSEIKLKLETSEFYSCLNEVCQVAKVPLLIDQNKPIWDSLAICEYINDTYLSGKAWPSEPFDKAKARSLVCEMHSGFTALRSQMPMNIRAKRKLTLDVAAKADIARIEQIWSEQYQAFKEQGGWLFGAWSIADAMYAPVALRFKTYGITLNQAATEYMNQVLSCPTLNEWINEALTETEIVDIDEAGEEV